MKDTQKLTEKFLNNKSYLTNGAGFLAKKWKVSIEEVKEAKAIARYILNYTFEPSEDNMHKLLGIADIPMYSEVILPVEEKTPNILVIGDTHIPYEHKDYLEFCIDVANKYNCTEVIHIGDIIDNHATSFHPTVPEAYSPGDELSLTKKRLQDWYKAFPFMKVIRGNHDERPYRIASSNKIDSRWMKSFTEVLGVPNWKYEESFTIGDVHFTHGTGTSGITAAYRRAVNLGMNVVIGHLHSEAGILYHKLPNKTIWGMNVGCGVDENSYGMNYAKNFPKKSIISCGVIVNGEPMIKVM